jgi:uncharacterized membrane protein
MPPFMSTLTTLAPVAAPRVVEDSSAQPYALGRVSGDAAARCVHWRLARNCALTPTQLGIAYLVLCAVSLTVGIGFAVAGVPMVLGFTGVELVAVGAAMLVWARHALDGDVLTWERGALTVERNRGSRIERMRLDGPWLRANLDAHGVVLRSGSRSVTVGMLARASCREAFVRELRRAQLDMHGAEVGAD